MAPSRSPHTLPRTVHVTLNTHKGPVNVARYSKGSAKYILTGGQDRTIRLWNANLGTEIKVFAAHGYEVLSVTVWVHFTYNAYIQSRFNPCLGLMTMPSLRLLEETDLFSFGMWLPRRPPAVSRDTWARSMSSSSIMTPV
jgi:hypothetical protein